jgi:hypothetical protein
MSEEIRGFYKKKTKKKKKEGSGSMLPEVITVTPPTPPKT